MSAQEDLRKKLLNAVTSDIQVIAKAENLESESLDWEKIFFEPKVNCTYTIKFLPNLVTQNSIVHRSIYNSLPDPHRKGKTFNWISSGRGCPVLDLFFDLNDLKKQGDVVAEEKIKKYLTRRNQACSYVQILSSPDKNEIGMIKLMKYPSFSDKATIATLLDTKLNPTKEQLEAGFEKENVFDIFESSVLILIVKETIYEGQKMRDMSASSWSPKKRGAIAKLENGTAREFTKNDLVNGEVTAEALPFFDALINELVNPEISIYTWFEYKDINDPRNTEEVVKYLKETKEKLDEILPIIRDGSLTEIAAYGKVSKNENDTNKAKNIMEESIPEELRDLSDLSKTPENSKKPVDEVDELLKD